MKKFQFLPEAVSALTGVIAGIICTRLVFRASFFWIVAAFFLAVIVTAVFYYHAKRRSMLKDLLIKAIAIVMADIIITAWVVYNATRIGFLLPGMLLALPSIFAMAFVWPVHLVYEYKLGIKFSQKDSSQGSAKP